MCKGSYRYLRKNVWWKHCIWRIAFFVSVDESGCLLLNFHGAWTGLLQRIFSKLQGVLFASYVIADVPMADIMNGKCTSSLLVTVTDPDMQRAAIAEWCTLIESMLHRNIRCQVFCCSSYEQFLNC